MTNEKKKRLVDKQDSCLPEQFVPRSITTYSTHMLQSFNSFDLWFCPREVLQYLHHLQMFKTVLQLTITLERQWFWTTIFIDKYKVGEHKFISIQF